MAGLLLGPAGGLLTPIAQGASFLGDGALAAGEVAAEAMEAGELAAGAEGVLEEGAEAMADGMGGFTGRFGDLMSQRRRMNINMDVNHHFFPQWIVYGVAGSAVLGIFAKYGRVLCCCFWPLQCCGGFAAFHWNKWRRCLCPCANEFLFLTIRISRIVIHQTLHNSHQDDLTIRELQVDVRGGAAWPFSAFSTKQQVEAGHVAQPHTLAEQHLDGGTVCFQSNVRDLPQMHRVFSSSRPNGVAATEALWIARCCFQTDHGSHREVPGGWCLEQIRVLQNGSFNVLYDSSGKLSYHRTRDPNAILKKLREDPRRVPRSSRPGAAQRQRSGELSENAELSGVMKVRVIWGSGHLVDPWSRFRCLKFGVGSLAASYMGDRVSNVGILVAKRHFGWLEPFWTRASRPVREPRVVPTTKSRTPSHVKTWDPSAHVLLKFLSTRAPDWGRRSRRHCTAPCQAQSLGTPK